MALIYWMINFKITNYSIILFNGYIHILVEKNVASLLVHNILK